MARVGGILLALLLAAALGAGGLLQGLERSLLDAQFRWLQAHADTGADESVVLIGFDETSTDSLREPFALWHVHLGELVQAVAAGGAAVLGLDVVLPDRSQDRVIPGIDRKLIAGMLLARRATPLILAVTADPGGQTRPIFPPLVTAAGPQALGYALLHLDSDGRVRRFDEFFEQDGRPVPTLAGAMARRMGKPVGAGLIDYGRGGPFSFVPMQQVLEWWADGDQAALQRAFAGKAVLFGSVLKYEDRHLAPVNLLAWDPLAASAPGVVLHGQILRNLLGRGLVRASPPWAKALWPAAAVLLVLWLPSPALALFAWLMGCAGAIGLSTWSLYRGAELQVAVPLLVAALAMGSRQMVEVARNLRERQRLRVTFGGYVSPPVMDEILNGKLKPTLGGERLFGCVLFSDIRGYTSRAEHMSPEQTIGFLNTYFERVVPIIHAHGGTVISFMGDGIMAVFGVPRPLPNPCQAGYAAALAMLADCDSVNDSSARIGEPLLKIGIGLNAGEAVAGHIGAAARHEYSVIGDVTNVASRLEGLTKEVGYRLVVSRTVADRLGPDTGLVALGPHALKGHSPVEILGRSAVACDK